MKYRSRTASQWMDMTASLKAHNDQWSQDDYQDLVDVLHFHEWCYYVRDDAIITDEEYDRLYHTLLAIEEAHPEWVTSASPSQRVGSDLIGDFDTVEHLSPMLSLPNSYDAQDLRDFDRQLRKRLPTEQDLSYVVEPKLDGGTVVLIYEEDLFIRGATRGNGISGEDITANLRSMKSIPLIAHWSQYGIRRVEIRGEAIIRKDRFEQMNCLRRENGLEVYSNPRNTATGGLRTKDPTVTSERQIEAIFYQIAIVEGAGASALVSQEQAIEWLEALGFKTAVNDTRRCNTIDEVIDLCEDWSQRREDYPYEIDGLVVKVNELQTQTLLGATSHHPRWAIAYKFKAKQATTKLEQVVYQVGKIGTITPVAKVTPVALAGVTVSSITMHNADFIAQKDLRMGDHLLIERAGDVIPYIVKALPELRTGDESPIVFPAYCPINDTDTPVVLIKDPQEAAWRCPVCLCGAQYVQRMIFFASKDAMNIDGLGPSIIETFYQRGWLRNIDDLYNLDYQQIEHLDGFGIKSVQKLRAAIEESKNQPINRLLYALGIHHLGQRASKILAAQVHSIFDLKNWTIEQFLALKDIGPVVAGNVVNWFADEKNIHVLDRLQSLGVNTIATEEDQPKSVQDGPLTGKNILFTGTLEHMTRKEAQSRAESLGAKNISAVSNNLDILVVGKNAGSKLKKAQAMAHVTIWTEEEFMNL